ncbi:restriction endonuclease PLD domain-containing protein [Clostridium sp. WILCCON 0269]|uniref:Restriction endonuclease PLD domain-containing protein n=1 Tax=Candidatus Clostridium eludens TaxID=3381663 RepID=A0ABW8SR85_9CLOT
MKILSNINSNHYSYIRNILEGANELYIVSPFLMESFDIFFDEIKDMEVGYITLITTLKDNNLDLFRKANALHSFCVNCMTHEIDYRIYIDNKLHGKVYIASKDGEPLSGIITSANFTEAGLGFNHEWGVKVDNSIELKNLINEIFSICSEALYKEHLAKIIEKIDNYSKNVGEPKKFKFDLRVSEFIKYNEKISKLDKRFFLKPVGWLQKPFSTMRTLSSSIETLHFSKRKPRAVRVGDILICYAVGTAKLLGYFEVLEEPTNLMSKTDRWPWSVKAKNLCPYYSEKWVLFDNTISSIQDSYKYDMPITYAGGKTLGALNFGADKIQLTEEFANHIISIIEDTLPI